MATATAAATAAAIAMANKLRPLVMGRYKEIMTAKKSKRTRGKR
jgi:hypothetical protein